MLETIKAWIVRQLGGIYVSRDVAISDIEYRVEEESIEKLKEIFRDDELTGEEIVLNIGHRRVGMEGQAKAEIKSASIKSLYDNKFTVKQRS